jgi:hypothetical protein
MTSRLEEQEIISQFFILTADDFKKDEEIELAEVK